MALPLADAQLPVSLPQDDQQFFNRLLSRELSNLGDSGRVGYNTSDAAGGVPFRWEAQPGKPKTEFSGPLVVDLPPLSLPPIRQAAVPGSPSSVSHSPKSITEKMKSLILSGKFSGPLSGTAEPSLYSSSSKSRRSRRSQASSDGSVHQASFTSTSSGGFPPKNFGKGADDHSPTSTLDYNSDRYSPSSSPLYYSPLSSSSSPSVSQNSDSLAQGSAESVSSNASSVSTNSTAGPAVLANCLLSISSLPNAAPVELNQAVSDHSPNSDRVHPEVLSEFIGRGALSKSISTARVSFADERKAFFSIFQSGSQIGGRSVSFNPGMRDPTCNTLDKLFPLKSSKLFLSSNQQEAPEVRQSSVDGHESFLLPCLDSIKVGRNDERPSTDRPAEELIKLRDDGNAFAYGPVSSAFVFGHRPGVGQPASSNLPLQLSGKRLGQPELKSILKKSRSTGGYSHELTVSGNDQSNEQQRQLGHSNSQKISSVLLRFAEAEEKLFNSRRQQVAEEVADVRGPACLPVCSFLGRAFLCRSKMGSTRNSYE